MLSCEHKIKKLLIITGFFLLLVFLFTKKITAETVIDKLNTERQQRQNKLTEIGKKIKDYTKQIDTTRKASNTLKNEIQIFEKEIASSQLQIAAKETQIEDTNIQIFQLEKLIVEKNQQILENKKVLAELLVQLNGFDDQYDLKTALGNYNFSEFLDQIEHNQNFQEKIYQVSQKVKALKLELEKQQRDLKIHIQNLEELKKQLEITQKSIIEQKNQKQKLLNQTRGLEKNYQTLLLSSKKEEENLEKEIQDLDNQIRAKLGKKSVLVGRGALAWPMDGILTQKYGNTGFRALGYNFHNGIDIAAPAGEPIYAAADGEVLYTDRSDASFGNWVAIKHDLKSKTGNNKIITLYSHMRSFRVSPGQSIKQGDLIGYEGNTGNTTRKLYGPERGYHVHFGVYDAEGFGVNEGKFTNIYGNYKVPFGYTYNPLEFLGSQN